VGISLVEREGRLGGDERAYLEERKEKGCSKSMGEFKVGKLFADLRGFFDRHRCQSPAPPPPILTDDLIPSAVPKQVHCS